MIMKHKADQREIFIYFMIGNVDSSVLIYDRECFFK